MACIILWLVSIGLALTTTIYDSAHSEVPMREAGVGLMFPPASLSEMHAQSTMGTAPDGRDGHESSGIILRFGDSMYAWVTIFGIVCLGANYMISVFFVSRWTRKVGVNMTSTMALVDDSIKRLTTHESETEQRTGRMTSSSVRTSLGQPEDRHEGHYSHSERTSESQFSRNTSTVSDTVQTLDPTTYGSCSGSEISCSSRSIRSETSFSGYSDATSYEPHRHRGSLVRRAFHSTTSTFCELNESHTDLPGIGNYDGDNSGLPNTVGEDNYRPRSCTIGACTATEVLRNRNKVSPGAHFTNDFSIVIQILWKFHSALIQLAVNSSLWNFAQGTIAVLPWYMQNFVVILCSTMELC